MLKIGIVGTGYVGLVQGVILAEFGMQVTCMDVIEEKIIMLKNGQVPIYEPGLKELMDKNVSAGRLTFSSDIKEITENNDVIFIAVGTPPKEDGSADLSYVLQVAENIAYNMNEYKVIVDKSTVPVGTGKLVRNTIQEILDQRGVDYQFDIVSNPEFLREGKALRDCLTPDRVVIGTESQKAKDIIKKVYDVLYINQTPFLFTNLETAEMIKYACNAFLSVKISYINEMALLSEKVGANIQEIARGMGMDGRISPKFLYAGPGYGGSCFPKDTKAIADIARNYGEELKVVEAAIAANEKQKQKMIEKITTILGENGQLNNKKIAILGLTFKPDTDDVREAPALDIIKGLINNGAKIQAYCPQGIKETKWRLVNLEKSILYANNEYDATTGVDAVVLITEWQQFSEMDLNKIKDNMAGEYFFDFRNIYANNDDIKNLFKYYGVGTMT